MTRRPTARLLLALLLAWAGAASAQGIKPAAPAAAAESPAEAKRLVRDPALYSTRVELLSQDDKARRAAIARALVQVVNQLTGRTDAGSNPVVRGAFAHAPDWVLDDTAGVSDAEGNTLVGGAPVLKASLNVRFDPNPVDSLIAAAGFKYWTGERPKPMLWLSIDDGRGPRLVTAGQLNVIKSLADRGLQRGLRFRVPQGSAADLAALPAVLALDARGVAAANARYRNDTMLIGKVYRSVSGWSAWWLLWQDGAELSRWPVTLPDARQVIASGADNTAGYFAKRDAARLDAGRAGVVRMEVAGIDGLDDYVRAIAFLQTHASVRELDIEAAQPGKLLLRVDLRSGVNAFRGLMRTSGVLEPLAPAPAGGDAGDAPEALERFLLKD